MRNISTVYFSDTHLTDRAAGRQTGGVAEIGQFHVAGPIYQDILRLDVAVHKPHLVQVVDTESDLDSTVKGCIKAHIKAALTTSLVYSTSAV